LENKRPFLDPEGRIDPQELSRTQELDKFSRTQESRTLLPPSGESIALDTTIELSRRPRQEYIHK
jgi:hypothetical protein